MFDRNIVTAVGGYPPFRKCQDYGLWTQIIQSGYQVANLGTVELRFDAGEHFMKRRNWAYGVHEFRLFIFMFKVDHKYFPAVLKYLCEERRQAIARSCS